MILVSCFPSASFTWSHAPGQCSCIFVTRKAKESFSNSFSLKLFGKYFCFCYFLFFPICADRLYLLAQHNIWSQKILVKLLIYQSAPCKIGFLGSCWLHDINGTGLGILELTWLSTVPDLLLLGRVRCIVCIQLHLCCNQK